MESVRGTDQLKQNNNQNSDADLQFFSGLKSAFYFIKVTIMKKIFSILAVILMLASCQAQEKKGVELLPAIAFSQKVEAEKGQVIDVRTPKEFQQGHLKNAQNIHLYDQDFAQRIDKLDKKQTVYVYCKAGGRSAEAVEIMQNHGFENIIELQGGTDSWTESGLPLEK